MIKCMWYCVHLTSLEILNKVSNNDNMKQQFIFIRNCVYINYKIHLPIGANTHNFNEHAHKKQKSQTIAKIYRSE